VDLTLRQAVVADVPALITFNEMMAQETEGISLDRSRLQKGVEALFEDPSRGVYYRHVEELARSRNDVCGLRLYVEEHNSRAQKTYESLGMKHSKYRMMEADFVL
jgi:GNAT superfamily N-acetyltransferase